MSWSNILTTSYVKGLAGISDSDQDAFLGSFIPYFISQLELETGLDFSLDDSLAPTTKVFRKGNGHQTFALNNTKIQIGAWQSITKIESASLNPSLVYRELVVDQDISFEQHSAKPNPIIRLANPYGGQFSDYNLIRVTGIPGFAPSNVIPPFLAYVLASGAKYAYRLAQTGGQAVASEKSVRLTVTYIQSDNLDIFTNILKEPFYLDFINRYKAINRYPY